MPLRQPSSLAHGLVAACLLASLAMPLQAADGRTIGAIRFTPCDLSSARSGRVEAHCARFEVPENHAAPEGRKIELRMALIPARSKQPLPDPVLFLAGGPGQSAVDAYALVRAALGPLTHRRHILLVDQRGTGGSNPLQCEMPDWKDAQAYSLESAREQARRCLKRHADSADPRFYTTTDYIQDLERVREALAVPHFNLIGASYGTRVALDYLRRHPGAVRSVFLDSVVPPELSLLQDHAVNLEQSLDAAANRCKADPRCGSRYGDVGGLVRRLLKELRAQPQTVTIADPSTHQSIEVPFNEAALVWVLRFFSYSPDSVALLPLLLDEAASGRPQGLLAQVEMLARALPEDLAHGMELSVVCAEDADLLEVREADRQLVLGADLIPFIQAQCALWPHGVRPGDFKQAVVSAKPVLLLAGEWDPVTPPRYAEQVARTLTNSRVLLAKGQGHTPMGKGCMPRLLHEFVESLDPAALDARCLEVLGDTPFFLGYEGPSP